MLVCVIILLIPTDCDVNQKSEPICVLLIQGGLFNKNRTLTSRLHNTFLQRSFKDWRKRSCALWKVWKQEFCKMQQLSRKKNPLFTHLKMQFTTHSTITVHYTLQQIALVQMAIDAIAKRLYIIITHWILYDSINSILHTSN